MINVVTVHWQSPKWITPQLSYLHRHLPAPLRVYASLNGIDDPQLAAQFHVSAPLPGGHAEKLNALALQVIAEADPADPLIFIDGDAFPVADLRTWIPAVLEEFPLIAIKRAENLSDRQPHPSFCLTTVGFWAELAGDWRQGHTWVNAVGDTVTDVGGNLLGQLEGRGIPWLPLLRTNARNPHPVWYGVYGHRVYHHGAGFRERSGRAEWASPSVSVVLRQGPDLRQALARLRGDPGRLLHPRRGDLAAAGRAAEKSYHLRVVHRRHLAQTRMSEDVYQQLLGDPDFFRQFDDGVAPGAR